MPIGTLYMCQECIYTENQQFKSILQMMAQNIVKKIYRYCPKILHFLKSIHFKS
jgi:hypothetical protein